MRSREPLGLLPDKNIFYRAVPFREKKSPPPGILANTAPRAQLGGMARAPGFLGGMARPPWFGLVGPSPLILFLSKVMGTPIPITLTPTN